MTSKFHAKRSRLTQLNLVFGKLPLLTYFSARSNLNCPDKSAQKLGHNLNPFRICDFNVFVCLKLSLNPNFYKWVEHVVKNSRSRVKLWLGESVCVRVCEIKGKERERERLCLMLFFFVLEERKSERLTCLGTGMHALTHAHTHTGTHTHIKCPGWCKEMSLERSVMCAVGREDTVEIDCIWNHYFLTVIDAPSLCIFIFSFTGPRSRLSAECGAVCSPVMAEVSCPNYELVCCPVCSRWQRWHNIYGTVLCGMDCWKFIFFVDW